VVRASRSPAGLECGDGPCGCEGRMRENLSLSLEVNNLPPIGLSHRPPASLRPGVPVLAPRCR